MPAIQLDAEEPPAPVLDAEKAGNGFGTAFVNRLLKKRLLSSPAAFASTLEKHVASLSEARPAKPDAMTERILHKAILKADEDYADDQDVAAEPQGFRHFRQKMLVVPGVTGADAVGLVMQVARSGMRMHDHLSHPRMSHRKDLRGQMIDPDHGVGVLDIGRFCVGFGHRVFRPRIGGARGDRICKRKFRPSPRAAFDLAQLTIRRRR